MTDSLLKFLQKSNFEIIVAELRNKLLNSSNCQTVLGSGAFGKVTAPGVEKYAVVETNGKKIKVPVAVKESKELGDFIYTGVSDTRYITSTKGIAIEVLIFAHINKLWHAKVSPHLPLMIGYSACLSTMPDTIVTERHGLKDPVSIYDPVEIFYETPIWGKTEDLSKKYLNTLRQLLMYVFIREKDNKVKLPNGVNCDVTELLDYLTFSCIHTHSVLAKHGISTGDMHGNNIFIHWLSDDSYLGDENIKNTKYIFYKFGDKIVKMKTFGILVKFGDVGTFIVKSTDKLIISGDKYNIRENYNILNVMTLPKYSLYDVMITFRFETNLKYFNKMVLSTILNNYPYNEFGPWPFNVNLLKGLLDPIVILGKFDKYFVSKVDSDGKSLVVKL